MTDPPPDESDLHADRQQQESIEAARLLAYQRNEQFMKSEAARSKRWARLFTGLAVAIVIAGVISMILIASHSSDETTAERYDRVENVSQLCTAVDSIEGYIQTVVKLSDARAANFLPPPPLKLDCPALITRSINEVK